MGAPVRGGTPPDGMGYRSPAPTILWAGAGDLCLHACRGEWARPLPADTNGNWRSSCGWHKWLCAACSSGAGYRACPTCSPGAGWGSHDGGWSSSDRWGEHLCLTARTLVSRWWGIGGMGLRVLGRFRLVVCLDLRPLALHHLTLVCPGRVLTCVRTWGLGPRVVRMGCGCRTQRRGSATGRLT